MVLCLLLMLLLSVLSIALRWFNTTLLWIDPMVRHLVLLSAFLGGTLAIGKRNHIKIDLIGMVLEKNNKHKTLLIVSYFSQLVLIFGLLWLGHASYKLVLTEIQYGREDFLGIHTSFLVGIIPLGFGLMVLRTILSYSELKQAIMGEAN